MLKLPFMLAGAFAQSAQVRARVLLRKTLIVAIAGGLAAGGFIFLIGAAHLAMAQSIGPIAASAIIGAVMVAAGIGVFFYFRRNLEEATPDAGSPLQAAAAVARDPSLADGGGLPTDVAPANALSASLSTTRQIELSPAEAAVQSAMTGNYAEAVGHATAVGRQMGKNIPPVALPVAGLAVGVALAWAMSSSRRD